VPKPADTINFEHKGIGAILNHNRLAVPLNQREYAWEEEHVSALFQDFANAIATKEATYFLGTIVLTRSKEANIPEVSDGQQRLATTTILLAAIRDYFLGVNSEKRAVSIEHDYLFGLDPRTEQTIPKLRLNVDDNEFFTRSVLLRPGTPERTGSVRTKESHKKIAAAAQLAAKHVLAIIEPHKESVRADRLVDWLEFIKDGAQVISLTVPDHMNAFVMFETLNDRGLRASQADLLKNYLLSHAGDRVAEAQQKWAGMLGVLESLDIDDITVTYLRHFLITFYGPTKEREVYEKVRTTVNSQQRAINFLDMLAESAHDYAALLNPEHAKWNAHGTATRKHIATILNLRVEQIRPLMFAVANKFEVNELKTAFRLFVSWSVRFLVAGGHRGGVLHQAYSLRAYEIGTGKIKTTKQLAEAMVDTIPLDAAFEAAFAEARVSQGHLARYYLRALEQCARDEKEPELVPTDEANVLNLEHVLPANPEGKWPHIAPEVAAAHYKRLGNMVLLNSKQNSTVGNGTYEDKKKMFQASNLVLTKAAAKYEAWGLPEITDRQRVLAKLAVETWPITVK
jgi:hypothetical protein